MDTKKPLILVIEDEELLLSAIQRKLSSQDVLVVTCTSGKKAIELLASLERLPDVIWLDYYLKDMNGLEFMKALKAHNAWARIPVVVVSNSANTTTINTMLGLGVKQYFLKAENVLDTIIETVMKLAYEKPKPPATQNA